VRFRNPVLPGMHPDPTVCRVGDDFYLACSSFEYFPGVPIFHSRDLVGWRPIGHALARRAQLDLAGVESSRGIYAPTLRHHDGTFYLVTTHVDRGNFVVTAAQPVGPWSDPVWIDEEGIDPSLAFLDGRVYYTRNGPGSDADHPFVYQAELAVDAGQALLRTTPRVIWKGTGGIWPEAPHLYRRGAFYYLVTAEGGTSYGHSVVVARARRPFGPFEKSPHGPLLTHRDLPDHPIQATGHADLVELEDGSTWAVLLGIRAARGHHHLGRETFLAPVEWDADGWPRMAPELGLVLDRPDLPREAQHGEPKRDDFDGSTLAPTWIFVRNPNRRDRSLRQRPGHLRLWGSPYALADVASPALVCRRQQHLDLTVETRLEFEPRHPNEQAGICVRANEGFHLALLVRRDRRRRVLELAETTAGRTRVVGATEPGRGPLHLRIRATARTYTFFGGSDALRRLGSVPARRLSAETIHATTGRHHFTGATIGLYATGNGRRSAVPADFDWFDYLPGRA
jgi:xylan 1,4-beta-xylosidase